MKQKILTLSVLTLIGFTSCKKEAVKPSVTTVVTDTKTTSSVTTSQNALDIDTAKGYFRVELAKDAVNTDEILVEFNPKAKPAFIRNEDAITFQGFGSVSLSSLSSDNVPLSINTLPLATKGVTIKLTVNGDVSDIYKLNLSNIHNIPQTYDIWLMDKFRKDSLDFRNNPTYAFNLDKKDTSTYQSNRFSIVVRKHH
jgi:hypothetical protein